MDKLENIKGIFLDLGGTLELYVLRFRQAIFLS